MGDESKILRNYPDLLSVQELQTVLRIGRSTAYQLIRSGKIASIRIGRIYRIPKASVRKYLKQ